MFHNRPIAFVLGSTHHGSMILNRNDYCGGIQVNQAGFGVGYQLLNHSQFDPSEVGLVLALLQLRRVHHGNGVVALDAGANIGVHTLEWARSMYGWGSVWAFEAQERVFYALAGNLALNNCFNAQAKWVALGQECGTLKIPVPNYLQPASFGSLELQASEKNEFIGQNISYDEEQLQTVPMISLDSLQLPRVDLIKMDVEGMEMQVLSGAKEMLSEHHPILLIEVLKSSASEIEAYLRDLGYVHFFPIPGMNLLALHENDAVAQHVFLKENVLHVNA